MKRKLKYKILAGFGLLIAMLIVTGTISIIEFIRISRSVNSLIEDNYKTIEASKSMLEALEREDSGILILILGEWKKGREILSASDSLFTVAFIVAKKNLTEPNEEHFILEIDNHYLEYRSMWLRPIVDTDKEGNIIWYNNIVHQKFLDTKKAINNLMTLNQTSMYREAAMLKEKSRRAIMPGIVSIIAALVFILLLNFFISKYFVSPITRLANALRDFSPKDRPLKVNIKSKDEIKVLEEEINNLINRISV